MARVIRDSVSDTIQNRLSDPRITGFVSVTSVSVSADIKNATVYLSIFGVDEKASRTTFAAICHAAGHIQAILSHHLEGRSCPHLRFEIDTKFKKTLQTLNLIDRLSADETSSEPVFETAEQDILQDDEPDTEP